MNQIMDVLPPPAKPRKRTTAGITLMYLRFLKRRFKKVLLRHKGFLLFVVGLILLLVAAGLILNKSSSKAVSFFPNQVVSQVSFPLYYPKALPAGCSVNKNNISANSEVVEVVINCNRSNIIISEQAKPNSSQLSSFYSTDLRHRTSYSTKVGIASIGALNNEAVLSLPTNTSTWIIVSSQQNNNQSRLKQIASQFVLSN